MAEGIQVEDTHDMSLRESPFVIVFFDAVQTMMCSCWSQCQDCGTTLCPRDCKWAAYVSVSPVHLRHPEHMHLPPYSLLTPHAQQCMDEPVPQH